METRAGSEGREGLKRGMVWRGRGGVVKRDGVVKFGGGGVEEGV